MASGGDHERSMGSAQYIPGSDGKPRVMEKDIRIESDPSGTSAVAGKLVRSLRRRRNMTLSELADEVGLSKGHLSRYERGEKSLSISALMRLAKTMGTSVSTLLGEQDNADLLHVVRVSDRAPREIGDKGYVYSALSRAGDTWSTAFILKVSPDSIIGSDAYHGGEEMLFVLSGLVEVVLETKSVLLRQGDFGQFPGRVAHRLRGLEPDTEILVVVVSPPGD